METLLRSFVKDILNFFEIELTIVVHLNYSGTFPSQYWLDMCWVLIQVFFSFFKEGEQTQPPHADDSQEDVGTTEEVVGFVLVQPFSQQKNKYFFTLCLFDSQTVFSISFPKTSAEEKILSDCRKAADWVTENHHLFVAEVELPEILQMGEEVAQEAVRQYLSASSQGWDSEEEKEDLLLPLKFFFHAMDDMSLFCEELADKRGYLLYCECRTDD